MSINRVLKFSSLIFSFILIYYLLSTGEVYNYLVPEDNKSELGLFRDWIVTLNDIYCQSSNKNGCRPFQYGPILLYLPFNDILKDFYYNQFPILLIILFIFFLFLILKNNKYDFVLIPLIIFCPTTLLAIERGNIDLLLFLIAVLICLNKYFYLSCMLVGWSFLVKYYPITFFANLFTYTNKKSLIHLKVVIFSLLIISLIFIFIKKQILFDFIDNASASKAGFHLLFSAKAHAKFFKYSFKFNYIFLIAFTYIIFFISSIYLYKYFIKRNSFKSLSITNVQEKLFLIGVNTSIFNYLLFSNYYYREIFLILSLPLIMKLISNTNFKIFKIILSLVYIRYFFLYIYNYFILNENFYYIDGVRTFYNSFLVVYFTKASFDFLFMIFLTSILFFLNLKIIRLIFKN
tara:strand:- start:886 stop:2097 length:1212 start_codon:yes stop_codon:yes gene_type:complete